METRSPKHFVKQFYSEGKLCGEASDVTPGEQAVEQAYNAISHAENALGNAEQYNEHMDIVQQNKEQLDLMKQQLNEAQEIVEDRLQ